MARVVRRRSAPKKRAGKGRRARSRVKFTPRVLLLGGLLLAFLAGLGWVHQVLVERLVHIVLVQEGTADQVVAAAALVARSETVVLAPADGTLRWLVDSGTRVRAGEVVAELANPAAIESAERDLAALEAELVRLQEAQAPAREALIARQTGILERMEEVAAELRTAAVRGEVREVSRREAELGRLAGEYRAAEREKEELAAGLAVLEERLGAQRIMVEGLTVKVISPLAGVVVLELDGLEQVLSPSQAARLGTKGLLAMSPRPAAVSGGETVRVATPLFKVTDGDAYLCLALPAAEGESLPDQLRVRFPELGSWTIAARVHHRGERERNGLMLVVLQLTGAPGQLGLSRIVTAELVAGTYHGPLVPRRALLRRDGVTGVLAVVRNVAEFREVTVLGGDGERVVVRGVEAGTEVVLNPWLVREGSAVR
ncbi:MAG: HlyD family efflux transporter periplasmic adaptor subunit [bacterium]|nr:HlyD family efflux transporter periplasmic adaptor subunit [bacterium]